MKLILLLFFPMSVFSQVPTITLGGDLTNPTPNTWNVVCTRIHIDTIKNVEWYVEVRSDTGFLSMPMSTGCGESKCTFVHTHNDLSKEDHWYDVYHRQGDSWAYYIHEVRVIALKPKGQPIIYPEH